MQNVCVSLHGGPLSRLHILSLLQKLEIVCVPAALRDERERTLIVVKPDGVQRRLVGRIIQRFEQRGFKLVGLKMLQV